MSINHNPRLDRAGLEPLAGQVALDDLRGRQNTTSQDADLAELAYADVTSSTQDGSGAQQTDSGEDVLNAAAWDGVPEGDRLLNGDAGFESQLGSLDLSQAADAGAAAVLASFG